LDCTVAVRSRWIRRAVVISSAILGSSLLGVERGQSADDFRGFGFELVVGRLRIGGASSERRQ